MKFKKIILFTAFFYLIFLIFPFSYAQSPPIPPAGDPPVYYCNANNQCYIAADGSCINVGEIYNNTDYCDSDLALKHLKTEGGSCLNTFECDNGVCAEGKCSSRYPNVNKTLLQQIWDFITGGTSTCPSGTTLCSDDNQCRSDCGGGGGPGGGPGGELCRYHWQCGNWSNKDLGCGSRICTFVSNCQRSTFSGVVSPQLSKTCPSTGGEEVVPDTLYCGDGICTEGSEVCEGLSVDFNSPGSCFEDCGQCPRQTNIWLWILIIFIILIILALIVIGIIYLMKYLEKRKKDLDLKKIAYTPRKI